MVFDKKTNSVTRCVSLLIVPMVLLLVTIYDSYNNNKNTIT